MVEDVVPENTYERLEASVDGALPIEYYFFSSSQGDYRFTSGEFEHTFLGKNWIPLQIERGQIRSGPSEASNTALNLKIPSASSFAKDYGYTTNRGLMNLTIYRNYYGALDQDAIIIWNGKITNFTIAGSVTSISIPDKLSYFLKDEVPNVYYQTVCNHVLYDNQCAASKAGNTYTIRPTVVSSTAIQFAPQNIGVNDLAGGLLTLKRTKETRTIIANGADSLTINYPFPLLEVGDECDALKGCDHSLATCKSKFNNLKNFGGHPSIPYDNPFLGDLD